LFESSNLRLKDEFASQQAIISQRQQDIQEITARIKNQRNSLKLQNEQIKISEELLKDQLTNRYKHLDLLKEARRLSGAIEEDKVALQRAGSVLTQARANRDSVRSIFSEEARSKLDAARRQLEEFTPRLTKYEDSLKRTTLRSPVDGVVKTLHVVTIGGVVRAGDPVIDVVPEGDRLIIEAKLKTQDIGYVRADQAARITLASADAMRFDNLEGKVIRVSPDTITGEDGQPYYKVRIQTIRNHFRRGDNRYDLFPGMQVMASIHTGERTVLEYILDPFLNAGDTALRER
ncbi:MAG: HlyD family type I secretion periplasmic adaptor subunit, partial [Rhodospirillaceae bacterium]|nr:HlyD family type I secretion periplasmic adaptor subunit [Rhodospirillaceae bacterium]